MQRSLVQTSSSNGSRAGATQRETIHDLRNLFGIVSSATHLLDGQPTTTRRAALLQAIEAAALRGGELTSGLLASAKLDSIPRIFDLNHQILALEPMVRVLCTGVRFDLSDGRLALRADPQGTDAVIFELLVNARAAGASAIVIRTRRVDGRAWLTIADNGRGMDPATLADARRCEDHDREHGTGLSRVRRYASAAHAKLHLHSRPRRGTVVSINLPTILGTGVGRHGATMSRETLMLKEKIREKNRRTIAA